MIKKYGDFINESLDLILESNIILSNNLKNALGKINSPISQKILFMENKDLSVASNYFDIKMDKNDTITFTPDKKVQEIFKKNKDMVSFRGGDGGWLRHSPANDEIFRKIGYTPIGEKPLVPRQGEIGKIVIKITSEESGKTYAWVKFDRGEGVYNVDKLLSIDNDSSVIWSKNRQEVKVGRIIRSLLKASGETVVDKEVEEFVNLYKAVIDKLNDKFSLFEVVNGKDIAYWYNNSRYFQKSGTLGNSCMSSGPERWFSIYTSNPEKVQLVILKSESDNNKIVGRAILWTTDDGKLFLDRIYTIKDSDVQLFKDYATESGWYIKYYNSSTDSGRCTSPNGEIEDLNLNVTLNKKEYEYFPYLDTLKYFNPDSCLISNIEESGCYTLEDTGGGYSGSEGCDECGGSGRITCYQCDGEGEKECEECGGDGTIEDEGDMSKCENCNGRGNVDCDYCDGRGYNSCPECQ